MTVSHANSGWAASEARIAASESQPFKHSTVARLFDTFDIAESQAAQVLMRAAAHCRRTFVPQNDESLALAYSDADVLLTDLVRQILRDEE